MPPTPLASPTEDQQGKLLDEALGIVKVQSFQMKCCLDKGKLMEALKHASNMLSELRTSLLSPKSYYELYMGVTDQLRHLEMHLVDEFHKGRKLADLYELVQYAGNIIPRLYLLITVGLVYMKTTIGCRRDILRDLVEMCRGVQHPLRGLFLRNYLLQSCRNVLPDVETEEVKGDEDGKEDHSGTVEDSIDFILLNFGEMNKLWVRMQHQGHSRDKDRREKERLELRLLVGTNLVRLSQLESVDMPRYKSVVLPGILEQVVSCRDAIAQEYLMECLIQVFPDEFHLGNLQPFLNSCAQLVPCVNVKNIIIALIDRLAASKDIELPDDLFDIFSKQIGNIIKSRTDMALEDVIAMQASLINFAIKKITEDSKQEVSMNSVLATTLDVIKQKGSSSIHYRTNIGKELVKFLKTPVTVSLGNSASGMAAIKMSLKLTSYKSILKEVTDSELHKQITLFLLNTALDSGLDDKPDDALRLNQEEIETFLSEVCDPLINGPKIEDGDEQDEDFVDEQVLLSRFIHYLMSPLCLPENELDLHYLVISSSRKILALGGPKRIRYTFPSLVFEALSLSLKYSKSSESDSKWEKKCQKIFQFVHQTITAIMKDSNCPELCLRLFLQAALNAGKTNVENKETIAYEFVSQAFAIYEEEISDSKQQLACLLLIISTVKEIDFKGDDNVQPLRSQCCLNGAKLVKKSDQCRAILNASLLFCDEETKTMQVDGVKCVKKCIKISSTVLDLELQLQLYVEILSHLTLLVKYQSNDLGDLVTGLIDKIEEQRKETTLSELIERQYLNNSSLLKKQLEKNAD
ncbi:Vacuolar protein sorting-associated protein 35 [Halotydeus destructor]|nr:Vacuolar protein sorting-associated protein 35 [Halotydeus destructor]